MKTFLGQLEQFGQVDKNWVYLNPTLKVVYGIERYVSKEVLRARFLIEDVRGLFRYLFKNVKKLAKPLAEFYATPV